nr:helix-turn-helix domain-containing protein [Brucella anthropi]DAM62817.1 MAG TPA: putative transcriptional regulator [Caudoviricetes sp.]
MIVLKIKPLAADRGIELGALAVQAGWTPAQFSRITHGRTRTINLKLLDRLCAILDCTPGDLIKFVPDDQAGEQ